MCKCNCGYAVYCSCIKSNTTRNEQLQQYRNQDLSLFYAVKESELNFKSFLVKGLKNVHTCNLSEFSNFRSHHPIKHFATLMLHIPSIFQDKGPFNSMIFKTKWMQWVLHPKVIWKFSFSFFLLFLFLFGDSPSFPHMKKKLFCDNPVKEKIKHTSKITISSKHNAAKTMIIKIFSCWRWIIKHFSHPQGCLLVMLLSYTKTMT